MNEVEEAEPSITHVLGEKEGRGGEEIVTTHVHKGKELIQHIITFPQQLNSLCGDI